MTILGFDTATRATTVALWTEDGVTLEARDDPPASARPRHTTRLMPLIIGLLDEAGSSWEQIDRVAVGVGPGTFTGLRIGIATARGLATARALPLVGVSTLESLALGAVDALAREDAEPAADIDVIVAAIDARRGEVFASAWTADRRPLMEAVAIAPEALAGRLAELGGTPLAVGDGAVEFRDVLERSGAVVPDEVSALHRVTAINHCRLAAGRPMSPPEDIRPEYLRLPDAEIARRAAHSP